MNRKIIMFGIALILLTGFGSAAGTISGYVYDVNTGDPLEAAEVVIVGETSTFTDATGYYELVYQTPDRYLINVNASGYVTYSGYRDVSGNPTYIYKLYPESAEMPRPDFVEYVAIELGFIMALNYVKRRNACYLLGMSAGMFFIYQIQIGIATSLQVFHIGFTAIYCFVAAATTLTLKVGD